jgi:hypothetical protein
MVRHQKFNLVSILSGVAGPPWGPGEGREDVDAAASGLYKTAQLAAGVIPPPLFF